MTKTNNFCSREGYKAPRLDYSAKVVEDLLCTSPDGLTEDFGETDDFTW